MVRVRVGGGWLRGSAGVVTCRDLTSQNNSASATAANKCLN